MWQFQTALLLANLGQLDGSRLKRARQPGWSATNGQLQAAQLPNYTNSTPATFASYWPITFNCQMNYPNRNKGEVYRLIRLAKFQNCPNICVYSYLQILQIHQVANIVNLHIIVILTNTNLHSSILRLLIFLPLRVVYNRKTPKNGYLDLICSALKLFEGI